MSIESGRQQPVDLLDVFFGWVRDCPRAPAVETADGVYSYEEIASLAFQLAATIQHLAEKPHPRVLIALPRSHRAYAAMLGSLVAGGTFCAIDMRAPEERNVAICEDFAPQVVLYENTPPKSLCVVPNMIPGIDVLNPQGAGTVDISAEPSDVAYVAFTSGSTGRPKGVMISRRGFSHFLGVCPNYFDLSPGEKWGQWSSLSHDLGVMDVFMALTQCGTLVPLNEAERLRPAAAIKQKHIAVWQSVPSVLDLMMYANQLTSDHLASLRVMSFCGEPLRHGQLEVLFYACPNLTVFNTYGATETIGFNTLNRLTSGNFLDSCHLGAVAIGECVPGWNIRLEDGDDEEGQIVVISDFLSSGYWQDDEGTRSAFGRADVADSLSLRCYRSGDWGVRRGGRLYCSGRMDRQVNIHGERIELGEIDYHLLNMDFPNAFTIFNEGQLHAFVESTEVVDKEQIRSLLRRSLSVHAIPRKIHTLSALPRNQSGKIDREALLREINS